MEPKIGVVPFDDWVNNRFQNLWWNVFDESDRLECEEDGTYDFGYEYHFNEDLYEHQISIHSPTQEDVMLPEEVVELGEDIDGNIQYMLGNLTRALIGYCPKREGDTFDYLVGFRRGGRVVEVCNPSTSSVERCELDWGIGILEQDTKEVVASLQVSILEMTTSEKRDLEDVYEYLVDHIRYS